MVANSYTGTGTISRIKLKYIWVSIFIHDKTLFGYFEYHGTDLETDMKTWANNKKMQEWWEICIPLLEPLESGKRDDGWIYMEEIFHTG